MTSDDARPKPKSLLSDCPCVRLGQVQLLMSPWVDSNGVEHAPLISLSDGLKLLDMLGDGL